MGKLSAEEEKAQKDLKRAMSFIDQGTKMISAAGNIKDMMQIEAGQKLIEFGSGKHEETENTKGYCSGKNQDTGKTHEM